MIGAVWASRGQRDGGACPVAINGPVRLTRHEPWGSVAGRLVCGACPGAGGSPESPDIGGIAVGSRARALTSNSC